MKLYFKDLDFVFDLNDSQQETVKKLPEFAFDDESLDHILYGEKQDEPTPASFYLSALEYIQEIRHLLRNGRMGNVVEKASELGAKGYPVSTGVCFELALIIRRIVPDIVNPLMEFDLSSLGPLLNKMWDHALKYQDRVLQELVGTPVYRWYEHHQRYEEARNVLEKLIRICHDQNERVGEAVLINNFAFEYLLEGSFKEAMPLFNRAAEMFQEEGETFEHANARANWLECRFGRGELEGIEEIEEELKALFPILERGGGRKIRKPLILLARIEEKRGNLNRAIAHVEQAIKTGKNSNTRYRELDAEYLEQLKNQMR